MCRIEAIGVYLGANQSSPFIKKVSSIVSKVAKGIENRLRLEDLCLDGAFFLVSSKARQVL